MKRFRTTEELILLSESIIMEPHVVDMWESMLMLHKRTGFRFEPIKTNLKNISNYVFDTYIPSEEYRFIERSIIFILLEQQIKKDVGYYKSLREEDKL